MSSSCGRRSRRLAASTSTPSKLACPTLYRQPTASCVPSLLPSCCSARRRLTLSSFCSQFAVLLRPLLETAGAHLAATEQLHAQHSMPSDSSVRQVPPPAVRLARARIADSSCASPADALARARRQRSTSRLGSLLPAILRHDGGDVGGEAGRVSGVARPESERARATRRRETCSAQCFDLVSPCACHRERGKAARQREGGELARPAKRLEGGRRAAR